MRVLRSPEEFREACRRVRREGRRLGLVPTMGALHEGHLSLVHEAKRHAGDVALTIFVNPTQFSATEDLSKYPRTFDADLAACERSGVAFVFAPQTADMYPPGFSTHVEVSGPTAFLEGVSRPEHFRGVTTIVTKLFGLAGECTAVFGRKDYQQWKVIERMTRDLMLPVRIVGHATVREEGGLALSSRNRYLSAEERVRALSIIRGLRTAVAAFGRGERDVGTLTELAKAPIAEAFDSIDYVALADADSLAPLEGHVHERALIAVAARLGTTRLIDNVVLGEESP